MVCDSQGSKDAGGPPEGRGGVGSKVEGSGKRHLRVKSLACI